MALSKQHKKPCRECPFRRKSLPGYLGANDPQNFAVIAGHEIALPCHLQMSKPNAPACAGRAVMWANQCKSPRDKTLMPVVERDKDNVFGHIGQFVEHHGISITPEQLMGIAPLDSQLLDEEEEFA